MFCPNCGKEIKEGDQACPSCGKSLQPSSSAPPTKVPNYLVQAILLTIFCCLPFGIPAIVFAAQVNGKIQAGDYNGAMESSRKAKTWCWASFGTGLAIGIIYIIIIVIRIGATR